MEKLKSRKLFMAIGGVLIILVNDVLGINIDPVTLHQIVVVIVGYLLGQGAVDVAKAIKGK